MSQKIISTLADLRWPLEAARGHSIRTILYQGSCIDPIHQCHTLDPASKAPKARGPLTFRLLIIDYDWERFLCKFGRICATGNAFVRLIVGRNSILNFTKITVKGRCGLCLAFDCKGHVASHSWRAISYLHAKFELNRPINSRDTV